MNASHNMVAPGFGLRLVYNDTDYPANAFLWALAAHREKEDRQFSRQPSA